MKQQEKLIVLNVQMVIIKLKIQILYEDYLVIYLLIIIKMEIFIKNLIQIVQLVEEVMILV